MIYNCVIKENNESDVLVTINNVDLLCFSNSGIEGEVGNVVPLNIEIYDDFDIVASNSNEVGITNIKYYQYRITGILNIDAGGVYSSIFFPIDNLYNYSHMDNKMVDLNIIRLNINNVD